MCHNEQLFPLTFDAQQANNPMCSTVRNCAVGRGSDASTTVRIKQKTNYGLKDFVLARTTYLMLHTYQDETATVGFGI